MSHFDLTDNQGNRYRLEPRLGLPGHWVDAREYLEASEALRRIDSGQLFMAESHFFFFDTGSLPALERERRLGTDWRRAQLMVAGPLTSDLDTLLDAISHGELALTRLSARNSQSEEENRRAILRVQIRQALAAIIVQERAEAAHHTQMLARESRTNRALIYTGAFFNGLWNAGKDLAKWAKEVNDVVNPTQRLLRSMHSSYRALQRSRENDENILTAYADEHLKAEKRELVQALGFDPSAITAEQLEQAMEVADLIWDDPALRNDITRFAKDYVSAQHTVELTNLSGSAAFEVLFTIILAAVTAGVGLAASAASQARHLAKFRKVGKLLMEFAEQMKRVRQRLRQSTAGGNREPSRSFDDFPVDEVVVVNNVDIPTRSPSADAPKPPENQPRYVASVSPEKVDWPNSGPKGLVVNDPRDFVIGKEIFDTLVANGLDPDLAFRISRELLESGVSEPEKLIIRKGEKLYKVTPEGGGPPGDKSPYFMTKEMLDSLPKEADKAGDLLGLPQIAKSFDVYEITATTDVPVYQSEIAKFSVNGGELVRPGGGT